MIEAYRHSVEAFAELASLVEGAVSQQVASTLAPEVRHNLQAISDPAVSEDLLFRARNAVFRMHDEARKIDPLSGEVLRPAVLLAARSLDRRLYLRTLQGLREWGEEREGLADSHAALLWAVGSSPIEDLRELAPALSERGPEALEHLRELALNRLDPESPARLGPPPVQVEENAPAEEPVRFLVSSRAGEPLDPGALEQLQGQLSAWAEDREITPQEARGFDNELVQVLNLRGSTAERLRAARPDLHLEPDVKLFFQGQPSWRTFRVELADEAGSPVPEASVTVMLAAGDRKSRRLDSVSDRHGRAAFRFRADEGPVAEVQVRPRDRYWTRRQRWEEEPRDTEPVVLAPLPSPGDGVCWWRPALGTGQGRGAGVTVAVVDSGIASHPDLQPLGGFCVKELGDLPWEQDDTGHGTHVAGILNGRGGREPAGFAGLAPEADLWAIRVSAGRSSEFYASQLIEAIRRAMAYGVDILNVSAGSVTSTPLLERAVRDAVDAGVLIVAAAGNQGRGEICYPARSEDVIGVSACGKRGTYPQDSLHAVAETGTMDGDLYFAGFSNSGSGVGACAPGVAIVSTLPGGLYGAWDGTSMASPMVAGVAACLLSEDPDLRDAPRNRDRVLELRRRVFRHCRRLTGWQPGQQGSGLVQMV